MRTILLIMLAVVCCVPTKFQVNTYTTFGQSNSTVSMDSSGNFVVEGG